MADYIEREAARPDAFCAGVSCQDCPFLKSPLYGGCRIDDFIASIPAADVVEEENVLKFYYVRSIDEYWIGQRIDNFYYAEYDPKSRQWVWTHSRYLPWGEHIVSPTSLWKEHTYPSEPEEIPFAEWLQGFIKKHAADVVPVRRGKWTSVFDIGTVCNQCGYDIEEHGFDVRTDGEPNYCPNCGADMISNADGGACYRRGWNDAVDAIMVNASTVIPASEEGQT